MTMKANHLSNQSSWICEKFPSDAKLTDPVQKRGAGSSPPTCSTRLIIKMLIIFFVVTISTLMQQWSASSPESAAKFVCELVLPSVHIEYVGAGLRNDVNQQDLQNLSNLYKSYLLESGSSIYLTCTLIIVADLSGHILPPVQMSLAPTLPRT